MDDIIAAMGSWLTETHEAKRRMVSNLEMLFWIAVAIVGALAAKDYATKRKALMVRTEQALPEKDLVATSFSDEEGRAVKYVGTLRRVEGGYTVSLIREADGERTESCSEVMPSLEKVEVYLTSCTSFVLSDFKS
ncbi:hypothetical protein ACFFQ5_14790 [Pseudomonas brassicacearum]|jgi:hypothetical protein|uniref:hypothetical protein n=1 Tax=Pseudomonas brassicacearum TaxID=930166 RepID=UPI00025FE497|nr:hypothetical protein [Pseudomonas brassicacearum]EIK70954.1 hypothetical protein PflQ8_0950 [Pseudomonas fluorescens Q8r1-96]KAB0525410.1 hypothetical protein F7R20_13965 [Pseudomonas brassicacearum subsp. brassicacearum]NJP64427.1 hypothetical protein [Pseudomonas brassicacearum]QEO76945.1 hypothetical protein ELZ14_05075 [Pseudomonas brassicacearum]SDP99471.1 hypothetical protein SAMN04490180_5646 [Pseudomonas brassicacearum]